jgi:hypothetical protein
LVKEQVAAHFRIGRDKLERIIKELKTLGYMTITANKDDKGKIISWSTKWFKRSRKLSPVQIPENPYSGPQSRSLKIRNYKYNNTSTDPINNLKCNNNNNSKTSNEPNKKKSSEKIIVSLSENLIKKLQSFNIHDLCIKTWAERYGEKRLEEVIDRLPDYVEPKNRRVWVQDALKEGWGWDSRAQCLKTPQEQKTKDLEAVKIYEERKRQQDAKESKRQSELNKISQDAIDAFYQQKGKQKPESWAKASKEVFLDLLQKNKAGEVIARNKIEKLIQETNVFISTETETRKRKMLESQQPKMLDNIIFGEGTPEQEEEKTKALIKKYLSSA